EPPAGRVGGRGRLLQRGRCGRARRPRRGRVRGQREPLRGGRPGPGARPPRPARSRAPGRPGAAVSVASARPDVRGAARRLAATSEAERDAALEQIALGIEARVDEILAANALDGEAAAGERLALDSDRVAALAAAVRAVAALPSPVGETIRQLRPPSGIRIQKVRVPLGVVLVVYEARPNVTVDAAALCLKSANACILRGSRMAANTNRELTDIVRAGLAEAGLPADAVTAVEGGHDQLAALIADPATADVVIPRGGEELKKLLLRESRIQVLAAAGGNCHVYVDAAADADRAVAIALNAK